MLGKIDSTRITGSELEVELELSWNWNGLVVVPKPSFVPMLAVIGAIALVVALICVVRGRDLFGPRDYPYRGKLDHRIPNHVVLLPAKKSKVVLKTASEKLREKQEDVVLQRPPKRSRRFSLRDLEPNADVEKAEVANAPRQPESEVKDEDMTPVMEPESEVKDEDMTPVMKLPGHWDLWDFESSVWDDYLPPLPPMKSRTRLYYNRDIHVWCLRSTHECMCFDWDTLQWVDQYYFVPMFQKRLTEFITHEYDPIVWTEYTKEQALEALKSLVMDSD